MAGKRDREATGPAYQYQGSDMDATEKRATRLKALKEAKRLLDEEQGETRLRFRNYELRDASIDHVKLPQAQPPTAALPDTTTTDALELLSEGLVDVAPKKLNFDLKRDVEQRLDLLEKRTMRALVQLQQEEERKRLDEEGGIADADASGSEPSSPSPSPSTE